MVSKSIVTIKPKKNNLVPPTKPIVYIAESIKRAHFLKVSCHSQDSQLINISKNCHSGNR